MIMTLAIMLVMLTINNIRLGMMMIKIIVMITINHIMLEMMMVMNSDDNDNDHNVGNDNTR